MNHQPKVRVIDAIMGSGKTTYIINQLNDEKDLNKRFLIITPYLKEIDRLNEAIPRLCFKSPKEDDPTTSAKTKKRSKSTNRCGSKIGFTICAALRFSARCKFGMICLRQFGLR